MDIQVGWLASASLAFLIKKEVSGGGGMQVRK